MITFLQAQLCHALSTRRRKKSGPFLNIDNSMIQRKHSGVLKFHCPAFESCRQSQCFVLKLSQRHYKLEMGTHEPDSSTCLPGSASWGVGVWQAVFLGSASTHITDSRGGEG